MRANYKAQIVEDPTNQQLFVRFKRNWYSKWEYEQSILYRYDTPRGKALEIATSRMESLVSQIIIAEAP